MRVLLATTNNGKLKELQEMLVEENVELVSLDEAARTEEIETGSTFAENALLKAHYYYQLTGLPTIADDSGLEVEALNGAPGIHSARFGGAGATDQERIIKLLNEIKDVPAESRGARFVCVAAFVWDGGEQVFTGKVTGRILTHPAGENGFGYDPIFFYEPLGKSFAQMTNREKAEVSHRGQALRHLADWLKGARMLDTARPGDKIKNSTKDSSASSKRGDV